jgi:L-alanine-DL-glutamate epimerase-like enolase superfamily enzyme
VAYLASPEAEREPQDVERVWQLMLRHSSIEFAQRYAAAIEHAAKAAIDAAFADVPDSQHVRFIRGLVPYMLTRGR